MSGLTGTSLIEPQWGCGGLVNFTTNYQATSTIDRAKAIVDHGGLLAIKADDDSATSACLAALSSLHVENGDRM